MGKQETLKTAAGIVLGVVSVLILTAILYWSERERTARALIDVATYCPLYEPKKVWGVFVVRPPTIPRRTAILIDATDRIPKIQRIAIKTWFESEFTRVLARFERITIYELQPKEGNAQPALEEAPRFSQCAPPSKANPWIENPRLVRQAFEQKFIATMLTVIEALASGDEKPWSPILEATGQIFEDHDRVILISDLMHHTPDYSLYSSVGQSHSYTDYRIRVPTVSPTRLEEKRLDVLFLRRKKLEQFQNESLFSFWREHLEGQGGAFEVETDLPVIAL